MEFPAAAPCIVVPDSGAVVLRGYDKPLRARRETVLAVNNSSDTIEALYVLCGTVDFLHGHHIRSLAAHNGGDTLDVGLPVGSYAVVHVVCHKPQRHVIACDSRSRFPGRSIRYRSALEAEATVLHHVPAAWARGGEGAACGGIPRVFLRLHTSIACDSRRHGHKSGKKEKEMFHSVLLYSCTESTFTVTLYGCRTTISFSGPTARGQDSRCAAGFRISSALPSTTPKVPATTTANAAIRRRIRCC